jgi:hypothetical protein
MMSVFDQLPEIIVIPMEDDLYHTAENGYCCGDPTCYCAGGDDQDSASMAADPPLDTIALLN